MKARSVGVFEHGATKGWDWWCEKCGVSCVWFRSEVKAERSWEQHLKSKRHFKSLAGAKP